MMKGEFSNLTDYLPNAKFFLGFLVGSLFNHVTRVFNFAKVQGHFNSNTRFYLRILN